MTTPDRRVQRTRTLLQGALIALVRERRYETITIRDIADRANVGRTTFYLHYNGKDDLLLSCHESIVGAFHFGPHAPLSRAELLAPDPPAGRAAAYRHLADARVPLSRLFRGDGDPSLLRRIRDASAQELEASLRAAFAETESAIPFELLAHALAGAQVALVQRWLERPGLHTPEAMAHAVHRLQRAAIRDALRIADA